MGHTLEEARAAKEKAKALFARNVGVGIVRVDDGYGVKVNLRDALKENIPAAINGVPVQFEVVGDILKQELESRRLQKDGPVIKCPFPRLVLFSSDYRVYYRI